MTTTLATGLPELDLEGEASITVDANDSNAVLTKVTIHLRAGAPLTAAAPLLLGISL